jgi:hypothetical protein
MEDTVMGYWDRVKDYRYDPLAGPVTGLNKVWVWAAGMWFALWNRNLYT